MLRPLTFWYEFAGPYSYPAAMRVAERAEAAGGCGVSALRTGSP